MKKHLLLFALAACLLLILASCAPTATQVITTTRFGTTTRFVMPTTLPAFTTTPPFVADAAKTATMQVTIYPPYNTVAATKTFSLPTTSIKTTLPPKPPVSTLAPTAAAQTSSVTGPDPLLPDLSMLQPFQLFVMRDPSTGDRWLFFDSTVLNTGKGALEMRGAYDEAQNQVRAIQRIYKADGTYDERLAGYFIYHPLHSHWHFEGFSTIEIYSGDGAKLVLTSNKMSFCMMDTARLLLPPPGSPEKPGYPQCDPVVQGISVGWADIYDITLPGQQLNIQDLPDGNYIIKMNVDPADSILESDETNNVVSFTVQLADTRIVIVPAS